MNKLRVIACLAVFLICTAAVAQGLSRETRMEIVASTVQIVPLDETTGYLADFSGSGTIISPSGYILTNFHVIGDLGSRAHSHWAAIYWTDPDFTDQPPEPMFWAEYVTSDPTHDLALLQITEWFDETPIGDQEFPFSLVGDSNSMLPGDPVTFVGYPGISGRTITFTGGYMSGWVGEDFSSGGKQWIKTDGKISHGNSGGGAYDENGYLIGVPTAGRTIEYDDLDREEQAYIRPISLAWALMGPFVTDVGRAPTSGKTGTTVASSSGATQTLGTAPGSSPVTDTECLDYCFSGVLSIDDAVTATIAYPAGNPSPSFHTYAIEVPPGTPELTISVFGDDDIDLFVGYGEEIDAWSDTGNWLYRDISDEWSAMVTIPSPEAGTWYIDVVLYFEDTEAEYDVFTFSESIRGEEFFELCVTCGAGELAIGSRVRAVLNGYEDFLNYHTYLIVVPEGLDELRVLVDADDDVDIALKYGDEIDDWADDGNWDYLDTSYDFGGEFVVQNPPAGDWFLDVFTYYEDGTNTYTVSVGGTGDPIPAAPASAPAGTPVECMNCEVGELPLGGSRSGTLTRGDETQTPPYHTYTVDVPPDTEALTISASGNDAFDFVVGQGEPITSWASDGNWLYRTNDITQSGPATFINPVPGTWYVDVLVLDIDTAVDYVILASTEPHSGAEPCTACFIADLGPGAAVRSTLHSYPDFTNYHTYGILVPEGQSELRVVVAADGDIDIAMKYGDYIDGWAPGDNWDYLDDSFDAGGTFVVENPGAGEWFLDIFTFYDELNVTYDVEITTR